MQGSNPEPSQLPEILCQPEIPKACLLHDLGFGPLLHVITGPGTTTARAVNLVLTTWIFNLSAIHQKKQRELPCDLVQGLEFI